MTKIHEMTKKIAKSKPYHHGELRDALVESALAMLEEGGVEAVTLRGVARRTGVSQAAPYSHFRNKEALLGAVATVGFARLSERMNASIEGLEAAAERIVALGCCYVRFATDHPGLFRLMFGRAVCQRFAEDETLRRTADESYVPISRAIGDQIGDASGDSPDTHLATVAAWSLVHGLSSLVLEGKVTPERLAVADVETLARRITTLFAGRVAS